MKNEKMAHAMSFIDYSLIEEANEAPAKKQTRILEGNFLRSISRYGGVAACALLIFGLVLISNISGNEVLLYGESLNDNPTTITEYLPRSVQHSLEPDVLVEISLPLELEFKRETSLKLDTGYMTVLDKNGDVLYEGNEYTVNGKVSICLSLPSDATCGVIETNRGYNIVLTKDSESGFWCVNIEK